MPVREFQGIIRPPLTVHFAIFPQTSFPSLLTITHSPVFISSWWTSQILAVGAVTNCLPSGKLKHTHLQTFLQRHKVTMKLREKVRNNISVFGSLGLSFKRVQSILDFLFFPVSRISLMVVVFYSNVTVFLRCHLIKRITICKGYQPEARGYERDTFIYSYQGSPFRCLRHCYQLGP